MLLLIFFIIKELHSHFCSIQEAYYLRLETSQTYQISLHPKTSCIKLQRVSIFLCT